MTGNKRGYRRTRATALGAIGVFAITFFATGESSATPADAVIAPGQGNAFADTFKIDPRAGNLSIGIDFGKSASNHQNEAAQAISQAMDLGTIGTSLASYGCDGSAPALPQSKQPQPLIADTRQTGAPTHAEEDESFAPGFHKSVSVSGDPSAHAITTTAPFGIAGIAQVGGGTADTTSGVVAGVREATATTDISGLTLPGGIELRDLRWTSRYASDGTNTGTFSIGSASIAGKPTPTDNPSDTLNQVNTVLKLFGLQLTAPTAAVDAANSRASVNPLALSVIPNATRDALGSKLITGLQPIREPLFDALLKAKCSLNTEITVFDIAVGSVTGAGSFNLMLGGVVAGSGEIPTNPFQLGFGGLLGSGPETNVNLGSNNVSNTASNLAAGTTAAAGGTQATPANSNPVKAAASVAKGARGGALAGVGLAGLGLLGAMAEGDRRKMRRAQREISFVD